MEYLFVNSPGTIDSDYTGEVKIILCNIDSLPYEITNGSRIAQMVIKPITRAIFESVDSIDKDTERGDGGFGHTGTE